MTVEEVCKLYLALTTVGSMLLLHPCWHNFGHLQENKIKKDLQGKQTGQQPATFCDPEEGRGEGGSEQETLQISYRCLIIKIQQREDAPQGMAPLYICSFTCM